MDVSNIFEKQAKDYTVNAYGVPVDWQTIEVTEQKFQKEIIDSFIKGANFATKQCENIALEFAKYVSIYYSYRETLDDEVYYRHKSKHKNITPSDLFKEFLNQRNKSNMENIE